MSQLPSTSSTMAPSEASSSTSSAIPAPTGGYRFPAHRLRRQLRNPNRTPLVLVAPGSFSPITFLHLRMFEMASDFVRFNTPEFELVGGYLTPVSDAYGKKGLAPHEHRLHMCELAASQTSKWLMVDPWEATQPEYVPTAQVLDHFETELARTLDGGGVLSADGTTHLAPRLAVLAGADLIQTMSTPGVWDPADLAHILGRFSIFVVERDSTDIDLALAGLPARWRHNIHVIRQVFKNNMSSTQVRLHLRREMSVRYLIPECVIEYIEERRLYQEDWESARRDGKLLVQPWGAGGAKRRDGEEGQGSVGSVAEGSGSG